MAVLLARRFSQKLYVTTLRSFSSQEKPYWLAAFPDGQPRSFDKAPLVVEDKYDTYKFHELSRKWFQKYGYVARQDLYNSEIVHLYHFDDFDIVLNQPDDYPERKSHDVVRHYRESRKDLYDNVGLGPGVGEEWWAMRSMMADGITDKLIRPLMSSLEQVADDLVKMLHIKSCEGDVDMLPWLFRWAFESVGVVSLNRRLNALSEDETEEADKMVEAAAITNESVAMSSCDPANFETYYREMVPAQDLMYSVIFKYLEELAAEEDSKCVSKILMNNPKYSKKNVLTLTIDMFQGALQTVPLTVLMALYRLALNKDVQDKARKEIMQVLPSADSKYTAKVRSYRDDIPPYLKGIVWETLRINPPIIGNGRVLQNDLVLGGYIVPKGTNAVLHQQVACLLEENFADPHKFIPERHPTPRQRQLDYIFGGRRRTCLGKSFAIGQMGIVLAKVLRDFEVSYDGGEVSMINKLHNEPEKPLRLKLTPLV